MIGTLDLSEAERILIRGADTIAVTIDVDLRERLGAYIDERKLDFTWARANINLMRWQRANSRMLPDFLPNFLMYRRNWTTQVYNSIIDLANTVRAAQDLGISISFDTYDIKILCIAKNVKHAREL